MGADRHDDHPGRRTGRAEFLRYESSRQTHIRPRTRAIGPQQLLGFRGALSMLPAWKGWPSRTLAGARTNSQSVVRVPLRDEAGGDYGAFAYGFRTALDSPTSDPWLTGIVAITNLGVFAQWFPARGMRPRPAPERRRAGARRGRDGISAQRGQRDAAANVRDG